MEIAGPARIAPLVAFLSNSSENEVVKAAVEQTMLTHRSKVAEESAVFLAKSGCQLIHGANLLETLHEKAPQWALKKADGVLSKTQWTRFPNLAQPVRFHPPSPPHSVWQLKTAMTPELLSFRMPW